MEVILLILAATYAVSGKHRKDTSIAAYKAGKEPPGLVKARLRHEAGGGRFSTRPGKEKTPKGPGATRLLIASRWAAACEKAKTKSEDDLRRWHAWYQEQAPDRDQAWRDKQQRKMQRRADRLDKWQGRWTRTKTATAGIKDKLGRTGESGENSQHGEATTSDSSDQPAQQPETTAQSGTSGQNESSPTGSNTPAEPGPTSLHTGSTAAIPTHSTETTSGGAVYQQGAATLHNHADEVDGYDKALTALGQDLESRGWGAEVHGPLSDMHTKLQNVAARYRDLAEKAKHQGDNVNDSYDEAPWAPDREALTQ